MFSLQATALRTGAGALTLESLQQQVNEMQRLLTACGPIYRNVDEGSFDIYGSSRDNAGVSEDYAVLNVTQGNARAGQSTNPNLYAAKFDGPVKFTSTVFGTARLATATANWSGSGGSGTVAATDNVTGKAITVTLRSNGVGDPNIRSGQTFGFWYLPNGTPFAFSSDDKIGTVKMWGGDVGDVPGGWEVVAGADARYLRGNDDTYGGTGGNASHTHTVSVSVGSNTTGITIDSATTGMTISGSSAFTGYAETGITVSDHPASDWNHSHTVNGAQDCDTNKDGTFQTMAQGPATDAWQPGADITHTVNEPLIGPGVSGHRHSLEDISFSESDPGHTHTVTDSGHGHTGSGSTGSANNDPQYFDVILIKRVS